MANHRLDTDTEVLFYENDFYCLSNFSAFRVVFEHTDFMTSEHAYHWSKFWNIEGAESICESILLSRSAHEALQIAKRAKIMRDANWDNVKYEVMKSILIAKVTQHDYVYRKLLETGDRRLIEDSWRDDYWGWGPNRDGQNNLGKIWMEIRNDLRNL